jgi:hypothetical protein
MSEGMMIGPPLIMMKDIILLSEHVGVARVHAICLRKHMDEGFVLVCAEEHIVNIMDEYVQAAMDKGVPVEGIEENLGPAILLPMDGP